MKKTHLIFESGLILSSLTEGEGGIGAGLKLNFVQNKHAIGAFYYFTGESWGYENVNYTGVTFGHHEKADFFTLDLSAGTGVVFGTHKGKFISSSWFSDNYEKESFTTMGIHGEFDFVLQLLPGFGIGTKLYAAYNPENPNLGAFILMKIGKP